MTPLPSGGRVARGATAALGVLTLIAALPSAAVAADAYVDDDTGSGTACTMPQPCATVQLGIFAAGAGDTVFVDGGDYGPSTALLGDGKSLREQDFNAGDGDSEARLDGGASFAVHVPAGGSAGTVQGFEITSDATAMRLEGPANVIGNVFDDPDAFTQLTLVEGSSGASITGNTFTDMPGDADAQTGVSTITSGSPTIAGNSFQNLQNGVTIATGSATVSGNTFTGTRQVGAAAAAISINNVAAPPTIVANVIHSPGPGAVKVGVSVSNNAGATLLRNEIHDHTNGLRTNDSTGPVTLNGDVIAGSTGNGIAAVDTTPVQGDDEGDVDATNATVFDNVTDINPVETHIDLDSSIVGNAINDFSGTCTIGFSRGPVMNPAPASGCDDFQTTAAPQFVDPGADDYHLKAGSPMIDRGNPANPGFVLDLDGQARAVAGTCGGAPRRDIGADELAVLCSPPPQPAAGDTDPPETTLTRKPRKRVKTAKRRKKVRLEFTSDEPGSSFECLLEAIRKGTARPAGQAFEPCTSPFKRKLRTKRKYRFQVRAADPAGNLDATPASHAWKLKRKRRR